LTTASSPHQKSSYMNSTTIEHSTTLTSWTTSTVCLTSTVNSTPSPTFAVHSTTPNTMQSTRKSTTYSVHATPSSSIQTTHPMLSTSTYTSHSKSSFSSTPATDVVLYLPSYVSLTSGAQSTSEHSLPSAHPTLSASLPSINYDATQSTAVSGCAIPPSSPAPSKPNITLSSMMSLSPSISVSSVFSLSQPDNSITSRNHLEPLSKVVSNLEQSKKDKISARNNDCKEDAGIDMEWCPSPAESTSSTLSCTDSACREDVSDCNDSQGMYMYCTSIRPYAWEENVTTVKSCKTTSLRCI